MSKQALGPNQEKWLAALESGEYQQGRVSLCDNERYCCLGVACDVFSEPYKDDGGIREYGGHRAFLPSRVVGVLGLRDSVGFLCSSCPVGIGHVKARSLSTANDSGVLFAEIAAFCREHPEAVFTEPR